MVEEPHEQWQLQLTIPTVARSGDIVASCQQAVVDRGSFVLGPLDLTIQYGERVALVGAHSAGKTTLIELILERLAPTAGSVHLGRSVVVGKIEQARRHLLGDATLVESFMAAAADRGFVDTVDDTRTLLAKFGLGAEHVHRRVDTLSPGERTRASVALLMRTGANLLVLDEPTNHLDIEAIEQLEQALDTFGGTVVLVTHDRALIERVRLTRTLLVANGQVTER